MMYMIGEKWSGSYLQALLGLPQFVTFIVLRSLKGTIQIAAKMHAKKFMAQKFKKRRSSRGLRQFQCRVSYLYAR
jgi:hypothetical protein